MNKQVIAMLALLAPLPAMAGLGGSADSVLVDAQKMSVVQHSSANAANYTVHSLQVSDTMLVKEFVTTGGQVFAVSWHGPHKPDLQQLLGDYFAQYRQAVPGRLGHAGMPVQAGSIVVRSNGRMGHFYGYAYVPALLPAGFTLDQIAP